MKDSIIEAHSEELVVIESGGMQLMEAPRK
jgi:hypothetical protein